MGMLGGVAVTVSGCGCIIAVVVVMAALTQLLWNTILVPWLGAPELSLPVALLVYLLIAAIMNRRS